MLLKTNKIWRVYVVC